MKRELILIRHTKSGWGDLSLPDFERTLKKDRIEDAKNMAKKLHALGVKPDLILCSPARRTKQTAEYFCERLNYPPGKMRFEHRLYETSAADYLAVVQETTPEVATLVLVGHNPSITDFANMFAHPRIEELPTTGVIWLEFNSADWLLYNSTPGRLKAFLTPASI